MTDLVGERSLLCFAILTSPLVCSSSCFPALLCSPLRSPALLSSALLSSALLRSALLSSPLLPSPLFCSSALLRSPLLSPLLLYPWWRALICHQWCKAYGPLYILCQVDGVGGGMEVSKCSKCAEACSSREKCKSYECSYETLKCSLNKKATVTTKTPYKAYHFCAKSADFANSTSAPVVSDEPTVENNKYQIAPPDYCDVNSRPSSCKTYKYLPDCKWTGKTNVDGRKYQVCRPNKKKDGLCWDQFECHDGAFWKYPPDNKVRSKPDGLKFCQKNLGKKCFLGENRCSVLCWGQRQAVGLWYKIGNFLDMVTVMLRFALSSEIYCSPLGCHLCPVKNPK